jgi:phage tail tape-measure protein
MANAFVFVEGFGLVSVVGVVGAGMQVMDTYDNAKSADEKAEGYGNAAGGLAGGLAGAAAGAALGSFIPIVGTLIGGIIGGALGAWGGGELGATVGKAAFGSKAPVNPVPLMMRDAVPTGGLKMGDVARSLAQQQASAATPMMLKLAEPSKKVPGKVEQNLSFAPQLSVTVQGDVKDPRQLSQELTPHMQRLLEDYGQQVARRNLYDAPHV